MANDWVLEYFILVVLFFCRLFKIALVKYKTRAALCKMVTSEEYAAAVGHKQNGVEDSHTYLTKQIFGQ